MKSARFGVCFPCLLAVVVVATVASTAGADTTLRWQFTTGQKRAYVMTQKTTIKTEVMGKPVETSFTQLLDMTWEVKGVDKDGNAEMVQMIERIRFQTMTPGGNVDLDTANAEDPPGTPELITKLFRSMTGSPFTMKITQRGEVRDVTLPAKVVEAFKNAGPGAAMLGSEETLKNMCEQSMVVFPEASVAPGKSWSGVRKLPMPFGTMVMDATYTLDAATGPIENIGVAVKVAIEPKPGAPFEIKVTSQEMKGHFQFDNSAGDLKSSEVVQKIAMLVTVSGQQIAQDLESTVKMETKNQRDAK